VISEEEAQQYYGENDTAHGFEHVLRVTAVAERIAQAEGANLAIVRTAALLHDVGRAEEERTGESHAEIGARRAREILAGRPADFVEAVAGAIANHRFRGNGSPDSLEACVLFDADKLDAIGAIGVARAYAVGGRANQRLWSPLHDEPTQTSEVSETSDPVPQHTWWGVSSHTPVVEFNFKLRRLKDRLFTTAGRALAQERHDFMVAFFERLEREVRGEA
jgi:uncharacterized protein